MTPTEQELISLIVQRYEAMQEKHRLRKEIAAIKRDVAAKVASGNLEGLEHHWCSADDMEDGTPGKRSDWYTTEEMDALYEDYHDCRSGITNILANIRYHCKKHIKQVNSLSNENKEKETT